LALTLSSGTPVIQIFGSGYGNAHLQTI
jgi:hypothetical protein